MDVWYPWRLLTGLAITKKTAAKCEQGAYSRHIWYSVAHTATIDEYEVHTIFEWPAIELLGMPEELVSSETLTYGRNDRLLNRRITHDYRNGERRVFVYEPAGTFFRPKPDPPAASL